MRPAKIRLGEILAQSNLLSQEALDRALQRGKQTGKKLGRVLVELGVLTEEDIASALANQTGLPFVDLQLINPAPSTIRLIPETLARRCAAVALERSEQGRAKVAMSDPADVFAYDEISKHLRSDFDVVVATESSIFSAIDRLYRRTGEISELAGELSREMGQEAFDFSQLLAVGGEDAPVVRLLQTIFEDAIASRASDVHIEPSERHLVIRFRIDGRLQVQSKADPKIAAPLAQRLKLISGLDISERRLPQDGRFNIRVHKNIIDVRIATAPCAHGESVVMRVLSQNAGMLSLDRIGMPGPTLAAFKEALERPQGMILVTGPTGSGKTTTLYSALNSLNVPDSKIITVEDPVEYRIEGVSQMQVHDKIGLTFEASLRSILRQDPDVILIGEMRDAQTVEAALRASMTGHLVLSTLHTNDAKSAPARMVDMGAQKFMLASSLRLVLAQRLARLNCERCAAPYQPDETEMAWLAARAPAGFDPSSARFTRGVGCPRCSGTGFHGRVGVYEMLVMDQELLAALHEPGFEAFNAAAERKMGSGTLGCHAARLAISGRSSVAEARRASH